MKTQVSMSCSIEEVNQLTVVFVPNVSKFSPLIT